MKFQIVGAEGQVVIDTLQDFLDTLRVDIVTHGGKMLRQGVGQWQTHIAQTQYTYFRLCT